MLLTSWRLRVGQTSGTGGSVRPEYAHSITEMGGTMISVISRRIENDITYFTLITYWENLAVIKNFAGDDYEIAKYYPKHKEYLLEFEEKVSHFEVFSDG